MNLSLLFVTLIFGLFQETLGSPYALAKDAFLRTAIMESARSRCYSDRNKSGFASLGWSLKESMGSAKRYIQQSNGQVSEDQFIPDPKLVEAYTEYFCRTNKFPHKGKLPDISSLNFQWTELEDPLIESSSETSIEEVDSADYAPETGNAYFVWKQSVLTHTFVFLSGVALGALGMQTYLLKSNGSLNIWNTSTSKLRRPEL